MMEPHIRSLTAFVVGDELMHLSWSRTAGRKASHESILDLQRVCEQERGWAFPAFHPCVSPSSSQPRQDSSVSPGKVTKPPRTGSW